MKCTLHSRDCFFWTSQNFENFSGQESCFCAPVKNKGLKMNNDTTKIIMGATIIPLNKECYDIPDKRDQIDDIATTKDDVIRELRNINISKS